MTDKEIESAGKEIWAHAYGTNRRYEVSTLGRIRSKRGMLALKPNNRGYILVSISFEGIRKGIPLHSLILKTFIGPRPHKMQCAHLNGTKTDNRLVNLKWVTAKENQSHKLLHGTLACGQKISHSKLNPKQVRYIRKNYKIFGHKNTNAKKLALKFGVNTTTITKVARRLYWKHLP